ncbi:NADPH2 dehydrogenase [Enterococcus sp. DIV2402]|uniref:NADPH2 dehydrogenase n=1 Tax=Candidatus Enterococcus lowellii TaxID=2230877 RepID=A0ABZ2SNF1_9ENTE|nr:NADPH dehydrogenase NamA [Enterococcus sp. DIV2402]MBO0464114.1 NADPH dehydrogenase NamA [Enterococcus sp. DIV2402]
MTKKLFESIEIRNLTLKNRIVMSPMCMYSAKDGEVTPWHVTHYASRAVGQVGLIILEATAVKPEGRISVNDLGIWSDKQIEGLKKITSAVKASGAAVGIQLAHAGRKAELPEEIFAPSAIAFDEQSKTPQEMSLTDIENVIAAFRQAAIRAKQADFDMIEIHAAHGYLINQFLSPLANRRQDKYGGSLENRYRLLKEVISAVREVWDKAIFVRISAHDYVTGGMTPADYVPVAKWLKEQEVDLIDVSSGAVVLATIDVYPGYQVPFAELVRKEAGIRTGAVGLIQTGIQAEEILKNERADLIFLGRELLRDPYWAYHAAKELRTEIEAPEQYRRGWLF